MDAQVSIQVSAFSSFGYIPRSGTAGSYGNSMLNFFEEPKNCFPQQLHHFTFLPIVHKGSYLSTSSPTLVVFCFSDSSHPKGASPSISFLFIYLFIYYLWLCWVFISVRGLSLVAASGGHSPWRCAGLSLSRPLLWWSTGSRRAGSAIVAHGPSCSAACGILQDQGSNPCPLHWQADSQPLRHQGRPLHLFLNLQASVSSSSYWGP